jgi:hypothetical protein
MQNSKKQMGILLVLLVVPAFFFIFFQSSFKNYYKLPYLTQEGQTQPVPIPANALTNSCENCFRVVAYGAKDEKVNQYLFNNLSRLALKEDIKMLMQTKIPNINISYTLIGQRQNSWNIITKEIRLEENILPQKELLLSNAGEVVLIDHRGFVRGKYDFTTFKKEEWERLVTEIKVLIEIVSMEKTKQ